jgi:hypothetical protein
MNLLAINSDAQVYERFIKKVEIAPNGCWNWTGSLIRGYGNFNTSSKGKYAHRFSYEVHKGRSISEGLDIDHLCLNPKCVNPDHLEPVTRAENTKRQWRNTPTAIQLSRVKKAAAAAAKMNAKRTVCKHGHDKTGDNVYFYRGRKDCKICINERSRKSKLKAKGVS